MLLLNIGYSEYEYICVVSAYNGSLHFFSWVTYEATKKLDFLMQCVCGWKASHLSPFYRLSWNRQLYRTTGRYLVVDVFDHTEGIMVVSWCMYVWNEYEISIKNISVCYHRINISVFTTVTTNKVGIIVLVSTKFCVIETSKPNSISSDIAPGTLVEQGNYPDKLS